MSKSKIIALAIAAVIVIGAAVAAVPLVRKYTQAKEEVTTSPAQEEVTETPTYAQPEDIPGEEGEFVEETEYVETGVTTETKEKITKVISVTKRVVTTKATTTTKKSSGSGSLVDRVISDDSEDSVAALGYRKASEGYYYCDDNDCWQKNAGYNEIYDKCAPLACMFIDAVRIRFTYGGKDWMVQLWKGQYGWLLVGAEIGLYTAPAGTYNASNIGSVNHYNCADQSDWLNMQLDCYWAKGNNGHYVKVFTRPYGSYWWATGFVKGQLTKYTAPRTELKTKNRITFKDEAMADLFVDGLQKAGFKRTASSTSMVDDSYYQNGRDVWVLWSTINKECFANYEGRE